MQRPASLALRPFVASLWSQQASAPETGLAPASREHVLPTGMMHLAIRLGEAPLRIIRPGDGKIEVLGHAVIAGARDCYYVKDTSKPSDSVGVQLRPGAARALLGVTAGELAGRHVPLDALLGSCVGRLREHLLEEPVPERRIDLLEAFLATRLPWARGLHPAVAEALAGFRDGCSVASVVARSGYSHRHLGALFLDAVGLRPQRFRQVRRFQLALDTHRRNPAVHWASLAQAAGYSDQAHFVREFRAFTGVTPQGYRRAAPVSPNHVPVRPG